MEMIINRDSINDTMTDYEISVGLSNIKSFFEDNDFTFYKPINVIVGSNGSGKTNLLNSIYYLFSENYIDAELKNTQISKYSILQDCRYEFNIPKFNANEYLTINEKKGSIAIDITTKSSKEIKFDEQELGDYLRGVISLDYQGNLVVDHHCGAEIGFFDVLLLNSVTLRPFTKLLSKKISALATEIKGGRARGTFTTKLTDVVSKNIDGITDFDFEKEQIEDYYAHNFIDLNCTSGGFQKLLLLQYLYYIAKLKKTKKPKNFLNIVLIDEIENGLHFSRQKDIPEQIVSLIKENKLQQNIKIVLTTHSPIVYSSFSKLAKSNPESIDIFYIYRDETGNSTIIKRGEESLIPDKENGLKDDEINKAIELELGLSIYDLPRIAMFVEGNDEYFLKGILEANNLTDGIKIFPVGGSPPARMWDFIDEHLLSYEKKIIFFFDEDKKEEVKKKVKNLQSKINDIKEFYFEPKELEFFIFGDASNVTEQNTNIKNILSKLKEKCSTDEKKIIDGFLRDSNGKNYNNIKGAKELYKILGKHHKLFIEGDDKTRIIDEFMKEIKGHS